jgi:hypothetical protein
MRFWMITAAMAAVALASGGPHAAKADQARLGPSFDCGAVHTPATQLICSSADLSRTDLEFVQAYDALRQQAGPAGWQALKAEAVEFENRTLQRCGVPATGSLPPDPAPWVACLSAAYERQRAVWLSRLSGPAAEEAQRPIEQHVALQRNLQSLGFLPPTATIDGVYGAATRSAILAWQGARGMPATGFLDDQEGVALESQGAIAATAPISARDTVIITHANAPLGLSLADAKRRFPRCSLSDYGRDSHGGVSGNPLIGYWPPFLDILPTFNGSILSSSRDAMFSKVPVPGGLAPTLDDSVLQYMQAWCGDPNGTNVPEYDFVIFHSRIMIVIKSAVDDAKASADEAMEYLAGSLVGQRGPIHQAISLRDAAPVLVTYSDDGNKRTILETEDPFHSPMYRYAVFIKIAYVDLPLWQLYSAGVIKKLQEFSDQREHETESIKKGL